MSGTRPSSRRQANLCDDAIATTARGRWASTGGPPKGDAGSVGGVNGPALSEGAIMGFNIHLPSSSGAGILGAARPSRKASSNQFAATERKGSS